jgi:hypothetical protein
MEFGLLQMPVVVCWSGRRQHFVVQCCKIQCFVIRFVVRRFVVRHFVVRSIAVVPNNCFVDAF